MIGKRDLGRRIFRDFHCLLLIESRALILSPMRAWLAREEQRASPVSQRDCFKEFAEMSRGVDCRDAVNGCRYETLYADLHAFLEIETMEVEELRKSYHQLWAKALRDL